VILQCGNLFPGVRSFSTSYQHPPDKYLLSKSSQNIRNSALFATKKKKKNKAKKGKGNNGMSAFGVGGFGGGALEACPCGVGTYSTCCSKFHKDVQAFRNAAPKDIVRARYAAYSKKLPEFLMMSTHPNNVAFNPDLRAWKESIKVNMYDKFDLNNCVIVEEKYDDANDEVSDPQSETGTETATVKFIAEMVLKKTGEKTSFMETSKFEKAKNSGAWLYLSGVIEEAPDDEESNDDTDESSNDHKSMEEKLASQL